MKRIVSFICRSYGAWRKGIGYYKDVAPTALLKLPFMKMILILLFGISTCLAGDYCFPFEVVWATPTNHWPTALWTYKVVPQNFSPAVISNLMALGPFAETNKVYPPTPPKKKFFRFKKTMITVIPRGWPAQIVYENKGWTRELGLSPSEGFFIYTDKEAAEATNPVCLPSEADAYQLGLKYLRLFGIDQSHLTAKESGEPRAYGMYEYTLEGEMGKYRRITNAYSVHFIRRLDGIDFAGPSENGGVSFKFGNNAKLIGLCINWKRYEPYELCKVFDTINVLSCAYNDDRRWSPMYPIDDLKKFTITKYSIYYLGTESLNPYERGIMKPFCWFTTHMDFSNTNDNDTVSWQSEILGQPLRPGEGIK